MITPKITDVDIKAAEKNEYDNRFMFKGHARRDGFLDGILHERAKVDELVRAVKDYFNVHAAGIQTRHEALQKALKQFSGRSG